MWPIVGFRKDHALFTIEFEPWGGARGTAEQSLLDCARQLNVDLVSICGGGGICGRCKVQVISGAVPNRVKMKSRN